MAMSFEIALLALIAAVSFFTALLFTLAILFVIAHFGSNPREPVQVPIRRHQGARRRLFTH